MAKQRKQNKQTVNKQNKIIENYRNPVQTLWGKIIIWTLLVAMVLGTVIGLIIAIIEMSK